ncbi:hypothetical protein D9754_11250 [Planomicrobium sp. Y74]|nr:hypothetical protein D9754_11250 [Planomicrobium sp. Y74]
MWVWGFGGLSIFRFFAFRLGGKHPFKGFGGRAKWRMVAKSVCVRVNRKPLNGWHFAGRNAMKGGMSVEEWDFIGGIVAENGYFV